MSLLSFKEGGKIRDYELIAQGFLLGLFFADRIRGWVLVVLSFAVVFFGWIIDEANDEYKRHPENGVIAALLSLFRRERL